MHPKLPIVPLGNTAEVSEVLIKTVPEGLNKLKTELHLRALL